MSTSCTAYICWLSNAHLQSFDVISLLKDVPGNTGTSKKIRDTLLQATCLHILH